MRILVTGHLGYIGTVMIPMLIKSGFKVTGLDSDIYRYCTFGTKEWIRQIPSLNKDIRDIQSSDLKGYEALIHLAGFSNDPLGDMNPQLTYKINYEASVRLAQLCKEAGVKRFIYSSSCSNYGAAGQEWVREDSQLNPVTPYGISKMKVEEDVMKLADSDFSPSFPRSGTAYGVSPRLRFDLVLNNLVAWAFTTKKVHLKSDGMAWRPLAHIQDISRAFIAILKAPKEKVHNQVFNIGRTEENYRIRKLAEIVAETVPGSEIRFAQGGGADKRCYRVDCGKLSSTLPEFKPQWNVRKGAQELYNAFKKYGLSLDEFEGPRYKRVAHVQHLIHSGKLDESLYWKT